MLPENSDKRKTSEMSDVTSFLVQQICNFLETYSTYGYMYTKPLPYGWQLIVGESAPQLHLDRQEKGTVKIHLVPKENSKLPKDSLLIKEFLPDGNQNCAFCPDYQRVGKPPKNRIPERRVDAILALASKSIENSTTA